MVKREEKEFKIIAQQIKLIKGINRDIEISKELKEPLMVRQYEHLKREYTKNLLKMLADLELPIQMKEAA